MTLTYINRRRNITGYVNMLTTLWNQSVAFNQTEIFKRGSMIQILRRLYGLQT